MYLMATTMQLTFVWSDHSTWYPIFGQWSIFHFSIHHPMSGSPCTTILAPLLHQHLVIYFHELRASCVLFTFCQRRTNRGRYRIAPEFESLHPSWASLKVRVGDNECSLGTIHTKINQILPISGIEPVRKKSSIYRLHVNKIFSLDRAVNTYDASCLLSNTMEVRNLFDRLDFLWIALDHHRPFNNLWKPYAV